MIPTQSTLSGSLTWSKISRCGSYELRQSAAVVGTLRRPSFWSPKYFAETPEGRWMFRRSGFLSTGAVILDAATQQPIATFKSAWGSGGILTFTDGRAFGFSRQGWLRPVWTVTADGGQPVLRLDRRAKTVEIMTAAPAADRLTLLAMFTWYRVLQSEEEAAAASTAVVAVIAVS